MTNAKIDLLCPLRPIKYGLRFYYKTLLLVCLVMRVYCIRRLYYSLLIIKVHTNNPRKRNSPLNARAGGIRVEIPFEELVCYVLCINRVYMFSFFIKVSFYFMHTCIHCNFFQKKYRKIIKKIKFLKMYFS